MTTYVGPAEIDCPERCIVPEGYIITEMPPSRHAWADVALCPNADVCDRTLMFAIDPARNS